MNRHSGFFGLLHGTSEDVFVSAVLGEPPIARLVRAAYFDATSIHELHLQSEVVMKELGHASLIVPHALIALTADPRFAAAVSALGTEAAAFAAMLRKLVVATYPSGVVNTAEAWIALSIVKANLARRRVLTNEFVVVDLLRSEHAATALTALAIDRGDLLHAYVHGVIPVEVPAADRLDVIVHNDDFSTMEVVVSVLTEHFDFGEAQAADTMLDIHRSGQATVATLSRSEAVARVAGARAFATGKGMPLRIDAVPHTPVAVVTRAGA